MAKDPYIVIMAGGIGSRFWPASRETRPKQFLDILGIGKSLLQMTYERFSSWVPLENILVLTHKDYKKQVSLQLSLLPQENILCEPARRNTAPCIAYVSFKILKKDPDACLIIVPSDHLILKLEDFVNKLKTCIQFAEHTPALMTLGIHPTRPDTGYGYIQYGKEDVSGICKVESFKEKPDMETAQHFLAQGNYAWNAGIFIWKVADILRAFMHQKPDMYQLFERGIPYYYTESEEAFLEKHYPEAESISIDFAIMEKAENVYTIPADIGWSDLGTWTSLHLESAHDEYGNALNHNQIMVEDASHNLLRIKNGKLAVIKGLHDFIIIDEEDVLLIWPKEKEQEIKNLTVKIKDQFGNQYL
ncbi:MAG TPA: sugar phosphate nucleotidyltransferase [Saprospiraceae bacterium]|nr:sugar phosphate nucleotidyltransferase [Saprospiraceae bacterium]